MKRKNKFKAIAFVFLVMMSISILSCKKKTTAPEPAPAASNGTVFLHLHTNVDTNEVDTYNSVYVLTGGRKISVSIAQLYISSIELVKTDGSIVNMGGLNIAKVMPVEEYMVGNVPSGNYQSIRFNVGLAPSTNSLLPEPNDSTLYKPNMWFGNSVQPWQGYVFVNLQGKIDTSTAANNTTAQMQPFSYRIGTSNHLTSISMPNQNYSVLPNQAQFIHIIIDYSKLFNGITLNLNSNLNVYSIADNSSTLSNQIANNIPLMFHYEQY